MAIIKEMSSRYGLGLSYHRLTACSINYVQKKVILCIASYLSKEARASQSLPIEEIDVEVPSSDFVLFQNTSPIRQGYLWLKANVVGFENALDDFDVVGSDVVQPGQLGVVHEEENPV